MGAYQRNVGRSFGPEAVRAIGKAFDELWEEIGGSFGDNPAVVEAARLALADAVLAAASDESMDVEVLKTAVLRAALFDAAPLARTDSPLR
jgi:hypothetical protein